MSPAGRTQQMLGLHAVPKEKFGAMLVRTGIGGLFVLIGIGVLGVAGYVVVVNQAITLLALIAGAVGLGFLLIGATVWSSQIVVSAMKALMSPMKSLRALIKGTNGD